MKLLKDLTLILAIIALTAFSFAAYKFAARYDGNRSPESFTVSGAGRVFAKADIAQFSFSVITEGEKLENLYKQNEIQSTAIVKSIIDNAVAEKDIATTAYNISPRYQYYNCEPGSICPPPKIVGYTISKQYTVKIRNFETIDQIISDTIKNGANDVSNLSFIVDEKDQYTDDARAKAIKNAFYKADQIVKLSGIRLGRILSVDESSYTEPPRMMEAKIFGMGGADSRTSSTIPGENEINASISLRFEVK